MKTERNLMRLAAASLVTTIVGAHGISANASDFIGHGCVFADHNGNEFTEVPVEDNAQNNEADHEGASADDSEDAVADDRNDAAVIDGSNGTVFDDNSDDVIEVPVEGDSQDAAVGDRNDTVIDEGDNTASDDNLDNVIEVPSEGDNFDNIIEMPAEDDNFDNIIEVPVEDTTIDNNMSSDREDMASDWNIWYHDTFSTNASMISGTPQYIDATELKEDIPEDNTKSKKFYDNTDVVVAYSDDSSSDDSNVDAETVVEDDLTLSFKEEHADTNPSMTTTTQDKSDVLLAADQDISKSHRITWMLPIGFAAAVLAVGSALVRYRKKNNVE